MPLSEETKASAAWRVIRDAISYANAWNSFPDPDNDPEGYSNIEGRMEEFHSELADEIYAALTEENLEIKRIDRLEDELMQLENKKQFLLTQVNSAMTKIDSIREEINKYS